MSAPQPAVKPNPSANAQRQRKAFKKLSILERETGMSEAEYEARKQAAKARVFERYGLEAA